MLLRTGCFSDDDTKTLLKLKGSKLTKVTYYIWMNKVNEEEILSLEWLELESENKMRVVIGLDDSSDGMKLVYGFDLIEEREKVKQEFGDKMKIDVVDMTLSEEWDPALPLLDVRFVTEPEGRGFLNGFLFLDFGDHRLEITSGGEGLIVGLIEEHEN